MKLYPMRKDGHTTFVKKSQIPFMIKDGWEPATKVKVKL